MEQLLSDVKIYRQELHQIPELGFDLPKTHAYVKSKLESFGYTLEVVAETGIIAYKQGSLPQTIAFRADMDALPVLEKSTFPYPSKHIGKMHACGHDGHMAMLIGFAKVLSQYERLNKGVLLIFQPAEETIGGAKPIVESGIFEKYHVEAIFGYHLFPEIEEGLIGLASGPLMAMPTELNVQIIGKSGHGGEPHKGIDALIIASHFIQAAQTIVSRNINPLQPVVLTIGKISGGEARSIIMGEVQMEGTIRTFEESVTDVIIQRLKDIAKGLELTYGCKINIETDKQYPPVINHPGLVHLVSSLLGSDEQVQLSPMMLAEDFSYYQQVVPGVFMMLGTRNEPLGYIHPLHSCSFNFDERVLLKGIQLNLKICEALEVFPTH